MSITRMIPVFVAVFAAMGTAAEQSERCVHNANCRTSGDVAAVCRRGQCLCGHGFVNPMNENGVPAMGVCKRGGSAGADLVHISWDEVSCQELNTPLLKIVGEVMETVFGGETVSMQVVCSSGVHVVVHMQGSHLHSSASFSENLLQQTTKQLAAVAPEQHDWLAQPSSVTLGSESRSPCSVYGATEVMFVGSRCVALKCAEPLRVADGVCMLDFHHTDGSGFRFTTGAIVVVAISAVGLLMLIVVIVFIIRQRCCKSTSTHHSEPVNTECVKEVEV